MSDGDIVPAARQRREGHRAPRSRQSAIGDRQLPWMQLRNVYRPMEIISADAVEAIHLASLKVLETTGISVQSDTVRALCVEKGAELMGDGVRMRFDRGLIEAALATVPSAFTLSTRNPKRDVPHRRRLPRLLDRERAAELLRPCRWPPARIDEGL